MAVATPAQGTILAVDEAYPASGTYTTVGQVVSIGHAGGGEVGERDTTVLTSTVKTSAPTIVDNGEFTVTINFDPTDAVHVFLRGLKDTPPAFGANPQLNNFKVTFATTATHTVVLPAWLKSFEGIDAEGPDDNLTAELTLRVTGAVTWV